MQTDLFAHYFDESHAAFRDVVRRFAETEILPHAYQWEEDEIFPRELYDKAAEAGILAPNFPEAVSYTHLTLPTILRV